MDHTHTALTVLGCLFHLVRLVDVDFLVEQQLDDVEVAVLGGRLKGCGAVLKEGERSRGQERERERERERESRWPYSAAI